MKKKAKKPAAKKPTKVSRKPKPKAKPKAKKKKLTVVYSPQAVSAIVSGVAAEVKETANTLQAWADIILPDKPEAKLPEEAPVHAADKVDINTVPIAELMNLAAHECSCIRLQRAKGIKDGVCTGECTHAKAVEELGDRGIVA